jgi:hypothetical protein
VPTDKTNYKYTDFHRGGRSSLYNHHHHHHHHQPALSELHKKVDCV